MVVLGVPSAVSFLEHRDESLSLCYQNSNCKDGLFFSVTHDHYYVKCFHNESNKVDISVITYYRIMKELWNIIAAEQ